MDDGETGEEVPMQFGISSIMPGRGECVACILVLSVVLSHGARLSASWADSDDQTKCSALDAVVEGASSLFTPLHADTPDGERFLQVLNGRFLQFASISYVSPQKSSNIHAIYYYCNGGNCAQCSTEMTPIIECCVQASITNRSRTGGTASGVGPSM